MEKVRYEQASDPEPEAAKGFTIVERGYARVRVPMRSGEQREKFVCTPRGAPSRPLTRHEINAKFLDTAGAALGRDVALDLLNRLWSLNEVQDVGEVLRDVV